jgi:hypothetical protein
MRSSPSRRTWLATSRASAAAQRDLSRRAGWLELPTALGRKYPNAGCECGWRWFFPPTPLYVDRNTRERRRHRLHETTMNLGPGDNLTGLAAFGGYSAVLPSGS